MLQIKTNKQNAVWDIDINKVNGLGLTQITLPGLLVVSLSQQGPRCTPGNSQFDQQPLTRFINQMYNKALYIHGTMSDRMWFFPPFFCVNWTAHPGPIDGAVLTGQCACPPHHICEVRSSYGKHSKMLSLWPTIQLNNVIKLASPRPCRFS